jgi:hypothetical protein
MTSWHKVLVKSNSIGPAEIIHTMEEDTLYH